MEPLPSVVPGFDGVMGAGVGIDLWEDWEQKKGTEWQREKARGQRVKPMFLPSFCSPSYCVNACGDEGMFSARSGLWLMRGSHLSVNGSFWEKKSPISIDVSVATFPWP